MKDENDVIYDFRDGNLKRVEEHLNQNPELITFTDASGDSLLHHAAVDGHIDVAKLLLNRGAIIDQSNDMGWSALHVAAMEVNYEFADYLLTKGIPVDLKDKNGETALHRAVYGHVQAQYIAYHLQTIDVLVAGGADVNAKNNEGYSVLDLAKRHNYP